MQEEIFIDTTDGYKIYGSITFSSQKTDRLVIFVHGFTGHKDEHIFFNGAKFFNENGLDVFRFDLYSFEKNSRPFKDQSISVHGKDVGVVKDHFKNKYKKIYLVGHSYGGTSLLFLELSGVSALIFWDASYVSKEGKDYFKYNKYLDSYIVEDRIDYIVGKKFVEELKDFPDCGNLISKVNIPVKFITAKGNHGLKYFEKANNPKELINIEKADHCFNSFESEAELLKETLKWISLH